VHGGYGTIFTGKREEEYRQQLGSFGVTGDLALRPIASLSGGQKSRLAFAIMAMPRYNIHSIDDFLEITIFIFYVSRPNFFIFDEPTNHLDVETVGALAMSFKKFKVHAYNSDLGCKKLCDHHNIETPHEPMVM
jgi:ATP-binding cassette subfamily F protein 3